METVLLVAHLMIALVMIGVILLQRSEGGALGIGGSSNAGLLSARGTASALTRTTAILAFCFMLSSLTLALLARHDYESPALVPQIPAELDEFTPVVPIQ